MSVISGIMGAGAQSDAADKAAAAQSQSTQAQIDAMLEMYGQTRKDLKPYRKAGYGALGDLQEMGLSLPGAFDFKMDTESDSYKWKQQQGEEAINRAMAARGLYGSRAGVNSLADFNQSLANEEYTDQYNRALQGYNLDYGRAMDQYNAKYGTALNLANMGMGSNATTAGAGQQTAQGIQSAHAQMGNALQQSALTSGQSIASMWNNLGQSGWNAAALYAALK